MNSNIYDNKTRNELIEICKCKKIKGYSRMKKHEILELLLQYDLIIDNVKKDEKHEEHEKEQNEKKIKMIDLFAGTGAFTSVFVNTGKVECVFANDMVEWSKNIYDINHDHKLTLADLNDIDVKTIPAHDILTGGFPCQPFSIAGKQDGFNDPRANVFWKIMEIVDYHNPRFIILENVKNLLSHDEGKTFDIIKTNLINRNYEVNYKVLDTSKITGVPQHRERVYIVCTKNGRISLDFDNVDKEPIEKYLENDIDQKYYYTDKLKVWDLVKSSVIKKNTIYQYRRVYVRENKNNECPTLTANMGGGGHNVPLILDNIGVRKLTPRECFNLQGFPKSYKLSGSDVNLYKLAGNAVSYPVIKLIAERVVALI